MTSGVAHNDWLIGYMDHNDYDSRIITLCGRALLPVKILCCAI